MSPFLEEWYHQLDCRTCGKPICFIDGVPTESDGSRHRCTTNIDWSQIPKCKECGVRIAPDREYCTLHSKAVKPKYEPLRVAHEKQYEGQQELTRWWKPK